MSPGIRIQCTPLHIDRRFAFHAPDLVYSIAEIPPAPALPLGLGYGMLCPVSGMPSLTYMPYVCNVRLQRECVYRPPQRRKSPLIGLRGGHSGKHVVTVEVGVAHYVILALYPH